MEDQTGTMVWLLTLAGLIGGAVATFGRRVSWISNKLVPWIAVAVTAAANFVLIGKRFLESIPAVPVSWLEWAPPADGGAQAFAGWSIGTFLSLCIALLTAVKVQFPLQRASFEKGEAALLYPDRVKPVPVELATVETPKGKAKV